MLLNGRAWKYGDNIDTDVIYPAKHLVHFHAEEVAKHAMKGLDENFLQKISKGDFVVAGRNLGCGSAREQAATALKHAGIGAVLAESFNRAFYRNCINNALPAIEVPGISKFLNDGEQIQVDLVSGRIKNITQNMEIEGIELSEFVLDLVKAGGAINYYREKMAKRGY